MNEWTEIPLNSGSLSFFKLQGHMEFLGNEITVKDKEKVLQSIQVGQGKHRLFIKGDNDVGRKNIKQGKQIA